MTYERAYEIRDQVEQIRLKHLLKMNPTPTLQDLYYLTQVLLLGYGKGMYDIGEQTFEFAEKFLERVNTK